VLSTTVVRTVLEFDVGDYVTRARETGREHLDPGLRARMAELYVDLRSAPADAVTGLGSAERAMLRLAELVLQSEWRLALPAGTEHVIRWHPGQPPDVPGKRYLAYAGMRLLNTAMGTRRHASDHAIDRRCRQVLRALCDSWLGFEQRSRTGDETWCGREMPASAALDERIRRLAALRDTLTAPGQPAAPARPPREWGAYTGVDGRANILEYLINLPQTAMHEENAFLRVIHMTEATTWGMVARVMSAIEWLKTGRWSQAAGCLRRAGQLAQAQLDALLVLRRTMSVEHFLGFRAATGDASAVQTLSGQLLHIHLVGVHPRKIAAMAQVPENAYLLMHVNPAFEPLRRALEHVPESAPGGPDVLAAARHLDDVLFHWRRTHLGLAHRYLPKDMPGSGGTSGAPYLQAFYQDRLFDPTGKLMAHPIAAARPLLAADARARPAFSPLN